MVEMLQGFTVYVHNQHAPFIIYRTFKAKK